jgi:proteasome accessory factor C
VTRLAPGVLRDHFDPLRRRMDRLLERRGLTTSQVAGRIRVLSMAGRDPGPWFKTVADATLQRHRLVLDYVARHDDQRVQREVSPQRLTHYRDCWYVDALDHLRSAQSGQRELRSFALDRIERATVRDAPAEEVDDATLDRWFAGSYGIFGGEPDKIAVLRFTPERARWVSAERWHPQQVGRFDPAGRWVLEVPYAKSPELVMDILRHGPAVEVLGPDTLRAEVAAALVAAATGYAQAAEPISPTLVLPLPPVV